MSSRLRSSANSPRSRAHTGRCSASATCAARQPALTAFRHSPRTHAYWIGSVLPRPQEKPAVLDHHRNRLAELEAITAPELSALAKTYLEASRLTFVVVDKRGAASKRLDCIGQG